MPITNEQRLAKYGLRNPQTGERIKLGEIGASDYPNMIGVGFRTPFYVWTRVTGRLIPELDDDANEAAELGTFMEPVTMNAYAAKHGRPGEALVLDKAEPLLNEHGVFGEVHADGVWYDADGEATCVVEAKTSGLIHRAEKGWGYDPLEVPIRVRIQGHVLMFVLGVRKCDVPAVVHGFGFRVWRVEWNGDLAEEVLAFGDRFWREHVIPDIPPTWGCCLQDLKDVPPIPNRTAIVTPEIMRAWREARAARLQAEKDEAAAEEALRKADPDAELFDGGEAGQATRFSHERTDTSVALLKKNYPDVYKACLKTKKVPTLREVNT